MRTYQYTAFAVLDRYDILYGGHKSDAGVGSGRRLRFSLVHNVVKCILNRTARFCCVFGSTDSYWVSKSWRV